MCSKAKQGRYEIVGHVGTLSTHDMGSYGVVQRMTVKNDEGQCFHGAVPLTLRKSKVKIGDKVAFTATVKNASNNMNWYKNPTKAGTLKRNN